MIYDSVYWKNELLKLSKKILKKQGVNRWWTDAQQGSFEKEIMIGFYIIRKLNDAKKLSREVISSKVLGFKFPSNGINVTRLNLHNYIEYYSFEQPIVNKFDIIFICNQIVHSYVFAPGFDFASNNKPELVSILFNSDDTKGKWIFEIGIDKVVDLFTIIGSNYPKHTIAEYDDMRKDWSIINSNSKLHNNPKC
jgi:hypothetical protein